MKSRKKIYDIGSRCNELFYFFYLPSETSWEINSTVYNENIVAHIASKNVINSTPTTSHDLYFFFPFLPKHFHNAIRKNIMLFVFLSVLQDCFRFFFLEIKLYKVITRVSILKIKAGISLATTPTKFIQFISF